MPGALGPGTGGAEGLGAGVAPRHGLAQPGVGYRIQDTAYVRGFQINPSPDVLALLLYLGCEIHWENWRKSGACKKLFQLLRMQCTLSKPWKGSNINVILQPISSFARIMEGDKLVFLDLSNCLIARGVMMHI